MVEPLPSWESSDEDEKKSLGSGERTPLSYISYHSYESNCRKSNSLFSDDSELSLHEIKQDKSDDDFKQVEISSESDLNFFKAPAVISESLLENSDEGTTSDSASDTSVNEETVVQSVTQITLSLEESVKEMDEVILGMKNFFENFKIENRHFSNKLKRSMIMYQQNAVHTLRKLKVSRNQDETLESLVEALERRLTDMDAAVQIAKNNFHKLRNRAQKHKDALEQNPKLTPEIEKNLKSTKTKIEKVGKIVEENSHMLSLNYTEETDLQKQNLEKIEQQCKEFIEKAYSIENELRSQIKHSTKRCCCGCCKCCCCTIS